MAFVDYNPWENAYENEPNGIEEACSDLWRRAFVWWDGKMNPCDVDYRSFLCPGTVGDESVSDIWTGKGYTTLREKAPRAAAPVPGAVPGVRGRLMSQENPMRVLVTGAAASSAVTSPMSSCVVDTRSWCSIGMAPAATTIESVAGDVRDPASGPFGDAGMRCGIPLRGRGRPRPRP